MGLETVVSEVEQGGQRRAQLLQDAAEAEAGEILAAAADKAQQYDAARSAQAEKDAEQVIAQAISNAEFEARKTVLQTEAELRERLKAELVEGFGKFAKPLRESHLERLLKNAQDVVPSGKVWGAKKDKAWLEAQSAYKFAGTADIAGGIIVEDTKGTVRYDLSYETLLDGLWRDILRAESDLFA